MNLEDFSTLPIERVIHWILSSHMRLEVSPVGQMGRLWTQAIIRNAKPSGSLNLKALASVINDDLEEAIRLAAKFVYEEGQEGKLTSG